LAALSTKPLFLALTALVGAYLLWYHLPASLEFYLHRSPSWTSSDPTMSSEHASAQGWHARANPHPSAASFAPTKDALVFAALLNAPTDPQGFTLALFEPDVAVDARGRVLQLRPKDFSRLAALAREAAQLPDTGSFMNAWRVAHDRTSQKIDRLFVKTPGGDVRETSVQGWHPEKKQLKTAVAGYQELPPVLQELFGKIQEGRTDFVRGQEENEDLISQVKTLVGN
ncbi:hypothetical protein BD311DRAFT_647507, partial [Dichomitus squalens]